MTENQDQNNYQLSFWDATEAPVSHDAEAISPLEARVLRFLRPGYTIDHELAFREIVRSPDVLEHQAVVFLLLNSLYRSEDDPGSLHLKKRGRELYDRIAGNMGKEVLPERHLIDECIVRDSVDDVMGFKGITLVQRSEERPAAEVCFDYAFGYSGLDFTSYWNTEGNFQYEATDSKPGTIAVYFNDFLKGPTHAGVVTDRGTIISKWKNMHVLEHPPLLVPNIYGEIGTYLAPRKDVE